MDVLIFSLFFGVMMGWLPAGPVLLRLDDAIARATLEQAVASLNFSKLEADRTEELFRQGSGSARARDQARAKLLADEAAVSLARAQLAKLELNAPFDGVLGLRRVSVGDVVQAGKDIVNLEAIDTLKLDFRVPELYLPSVRVGHEGVLDQLEGEGARR